MKESVNSLNNAHRMKVASSPPSRNHSLPNSKSSGSSGVDPINKSANRTQQGVDSKNIFGSNCNNSNTNSASFDDYNEWELGIGNLIIDLDADIEKNNERSLNGSCLAETTSSSNKECENANNFISNGGLNNSTPSSTSSGGTSVTKKSTLGSDSTKYHLSNSKMSSSKGGRLNNTIVSSSSSANSNTSGDHHHHHYHHHHSSSLSGSSGTVEHQATVDKGLKMKIKRKNIGGKSEAKHEIVCSDISPNVSKYASDGNNNSSASISSISNIGSGSSSSIGSSSMSGSTNESKVKHSSSKSRNCGHKDKKERREKVVTAKSGSEVNGLSSCMKSPPPNTTIASSLPSVLSSSSLTCATSSSHSSSPKSSNVSASLSLSSPTLTSFASSLTCASNKLINCTSSNMQNSNKSTNSLPTDGPSSSIIVSSNVKNANLKYASSSFNPSVILRPEDASKCSPAKRPRTDKEEKKLKLMYKESDINNANIGECDINSNGSNITSLPEMKNISTCTSVGTVTEPDCLGPCEPGTSVTLEGIVWQETEGGVLVVNVTWRGKTYVGTLLDCTKHDWAPPRFCESPTSDIEAKSSKNSRSKRGRAVNEAVCDVSNVHSKLRNGKGRRTANSGFTIPASPSRGVDNVCKRKSRNENEPPVASPDKSKRNRIITKPVGTPEPNSNTSGNNVPLSSSTSTISTDGNGTTNSNSSVNNSGVLSSPSSPNLIECPEPNCSKKYKHINGLKYHQTHAHGDITVKIDDEDAKDNEDEEEEEACPKEYDEIGEDETTGLVNFSDGPEFGNNEQVHDMININEDKDCDKFASKKCIKTSSFPPLTQKNVIGTKDEIENNMGRLETSRRDKIKQKKKSKEREKERQCEIRKIDSKNVSSKSKQDEKESVEVKALENVHSPAYSDISDAEEREDVEDVGDEEKRSEVGSPRSFTMFPFYNSSSYLIGASPKQPSCLSGSTLNPNSAGHLGLSSISPLGPGTSLNLAPNQHLGLSSNQPLGLTPGSLGLSPSASLGPSLGLPTNLSSSAKPTSPQPQKQSTTSSLQGNASLSRKEVERRGDFETRVSEASNEITIDEKNEKRYSNLLSNNLAPNFPIVSNCPTASGSILGSVAVSSMSTSSENPLSSTILSSTSGHHPPSNLTPTSLSTVNLTQSGLVCNLTSGIETNVLSPVGLPSVLSSTGMGASGSSTGVIPGSEFGPSSLAPSFPFPYGFMQGYAGYSLDPAYHMQILSNYPHYKQQYERLIVERERERERMFDNTSEKSFNKEGSCRDGGIKGFELNRIKQTTKEIKHDVMTTKHSTPPSIGGMRIGSMFNMVPLEGGMLKEESVIR